MVIPRLNTISQRIIFTCWKNIQASADLGQGEGKFGKHRKFACENLVMKFELPFHNRDF